jgi:hypothetical protein
MFPRKQIVEPVISEQSVSDIRILSVAILHTMLMHRAITYHRQWSKRSKHKRAVFANIRVNKRMDKFSLRGKIKVNIQWLLYCMVHNIEKVANYGFA